MPLISFVSNQYKNELIKTIATHDVIAILMVPSFTYDTDTHNFLADVTASQIPTGYGYEQDAKILSGGTVTRDDANDKSYVSWANPTWTASGGAIGPFGSVLFVDTTITDSPIMGGSNFGVDGNEDQITYTIADGTSWVAQTIKVSSVNAG